MGEGGRRGGKGGRRGGKKEGKKGGKGGRGVIGCWWRGCLIGGMWWKRMSCWRVIGRGGRSFVGLGEGVGGGRGGGGGRGRERRKGKEKESFPSHIYIPPFFFSLFNSFVLSPPPQPPKQTFSFPLPFPSLPSLILPKSQGETFTVWRRRRRMSSREEGERKREKAKAKGKGIAK